MVYIFLFILGASWGSFLNVVAGRIQAKRSFLGGRSACTHCGKQICWYDLFPVLSWLVLLGKCRFCNHRLSTRYILVELASGALFALGVGMFVSVASAALYLSVVSFFVVLFLYDFQTYIIPDRIVIPGIIVIGGLNAMVVGAPISLLLGALCGGAWFLVQFLVSSGRWVGGGDIRLGVLMGVLLGYPMIFLGLGLAYVGGSVVALLLIAAKQTTIKSKIPFATLLLPATFVAWLWGEFIWEWYRTIIGL